MIIKASALGRRAHGYLTKHLGNVHDGNERILLSGSRGLFANSLSESIEDIMLLSMGARCRKPLLHTSINPSVDLSEGQWALAWSLYEQEFDLDGHAYVEVTHTKTDGRTHRHRVYSRIREEDHTSIDLAFNYLRHEKIARLLEYTFNRPLTLGRFNRAIIKRLDQDGQGAVATWMREEGAHTRNRPTARETSNDNQQAKRTKIDTQQVREDLKVAYQQAAQDQSEKTGQLFLNLILQKGYILAIGDRRDYVLLDRTANVHSPTRRLGVRAGALRTFLADLVPEHLPTVGQVQQVVRELRGKAEPTAEASRAAKLSVEQKELVGRFLDICR